MIETIQDLTAARFMLQISILHVREADKISTLKLKEDFPLSSHYLTQ